MLQINSFIADAPNDDYDIKRFNIDGWIESLHVNNEKPVTKQPVETAPQLVSIKS